MSFRDPNWNGPRIGSPEFDALDPDGQYEAATQMFLRNEITNNVWDGYIVQAHNWHYERRKRERDAQVPAFQLVARLREVVPDSHLPLLEKLEQEYRQLEELAGAYAFMGRC